MNQPERAEQCRLRIGPPCREEVEEEDLNIMIVKTFTNALESQL